MFFGFFLSIYAPVNFLQLGRYGKYGEQRYRQQFEDDFDFFNFNATLIQQHCGTRRAIALDMCWQKTTYEKSPLWNGLKIQYGVPKRAENRFFVERKGFF